MTFLKEKRRAGVVAVLAMLMGAAALMFGAGGAAASVPCSDEADPYPDTHVRVGSQTYLGLNHTTNTGGMGYGVWTCYAVTGGEGNDYNTGVGTHDPNSSTAGRTVEVIHCSEGPDLSNCSYVLAPTGAEVNPRTSANTPADGDSTSAAEAGSATGTCAYVDGIPICPGNQTVAGVTVNENDVVPVVTTYTPAPPCTGVNNTCLPVGATVRLFNDNSAPTAGVNSSANHVVFGSPFVVDIGPECVQVNAVC